MSDVSGIAISFCGLANGESFPKPVEVHRAERSIVQAVARLPRLAPDHASVIRAYRPRETCLVQRSEHRTHVHVAELRWVWSLVERAWPRTLDVAAVRKVDAPLRPEAANDGRKIVLWVSSQRAGAKGDAICGIVDDPRDSLERRAIGNDSWQGKERPRWIIRMQRHAHAGRCGHRYDALQKIRKVVP